MIESVDGRPTDQTQQVFDLLNSQLTTQLDKLAQIVATDVPSFNQLIQTLGPAPIARSAVCQ